MSTAPWNGFGKIVDSNYTDDSNKKCEKPTISYNNGKLAFNCTTDDVEYVTEITDNDIQKHYDAIITLSATYNISVYATKTGYEDSDVVTATLCWIDSEPKTEGISNGAASVRANAIMIKPENGHLILRCNSLISEGMSFPFNVTKIGIF